MYYEEVKKRILFPNGTQRIITITNDNSNKYIHYYLNGTAKYVTPIQQFRKNLEIIT